MTTPNRKLVEILRPAYRCTSFDDACRGTATWKPNFGYVPRGFVGALGTIDEVVVVILSDRPSNPFPQEEYSTPDELEQTSRFTFHCLQDGTDREFHTNLGYFLDLLFPDLRHDLKSQLRKAWVSNSYLCSADKVSVREWEVCVNKYLAPQLELLCGRPVIAFGSGGRPCETGGGRPESVIRGRFVFTAQSRPKTQSSSYLARGREVGTTYALADRQSDVIVH